MRASSQHRQRQLGPITSIRRTDVRGWRWPRPDHGLTTRGHDRDVLGVATKSVTTHVSAWFKRGAGPPASGVSPISTSGFKRGAGPPASGVSPISTSRFKRVQALQPRASARYRHPGSNGAQALQPRASASHESIALTCEVGGDPVRTTVSRPVVMSVSTMVRAHVPTRDHARECVVQTGRRPSSLGRQHRMNRSHSRARLEVTPFEPRSHDPWS